MKEGDDELSQSFSGDDSSAGNCICNFNCGGKCDYHFRFRNETVPRSQRLISLSSAFNFKSLVTVICKLTLA